MTSAKRRTSRRLYERAGFRAVARNGGSDTTLLELDPPSDWTGRPGSSATGD